MDTTRAAITHKPDTCIYARFSKRLLAYVIDMIVSLILMLPLLLWYARGLFSDQSGTYLLGYGIFLFGGICSIRMLYLVVGWSILQGTVGCFITRIRVVTVQGKPVTFWVALARYLGLLVSTMLFGLGWIPIFLTSKHQGIHDLIASTVVCTEK
jgi:uncharacterized RDD family membrane protein YckC